jgi:hypothetical protein
LALYKGQFTASETAGVSYMVNANSSISYGLDGAGYKYSTCPVSSTLLVFANSVSGATVDVTLAELFQVTAPSSSGCTIVSAKAGETYNFSFKNPSFTYNSSSYYCIIKAIR